jgi:hypothetical protein
MELMATNEFIFANVQWETESYRTGTDYTETIREWIKSAEVGCKRCGDDWTATSGSERGQLRQETLDTVEIRCRCCAASESIPIVRFY